MNIFKILSSGNGNISETNLSAFLGYLLNPNEDHGLGTLLLKKILFEHVKYNTNSNLNSLLNNDKTDILDLSNGYRVEVYLEQTVENEMKRENENGMCNEGVTPTQRVDIVVLIYKVNSPTAQKALLGSLSEKPTLKNVILIEVKKDDSASKADQLIAQFDNTISELTKLSLAPEKLNIDVNDGKFLDNISLIYLTPSGGNSDNSFNLLYMKPTLKKYPKTHLFWKTSDEESLLTIENRFEDKKGKWIENEDDEEGSKNSENLQIISFLKEKFTDFKFDKSMKSLIENKFINIKIQSIESIINNIISPEAGVRSEIIPTYTAETLQSFSNFIYSDFKSLLKEKLPKVNSKHFDTLDDLINSGTCYLNLDEIDRIRDLYNSDLNKRKYLEKQNKNITKTHILKFYKGVNKFCTISNYNNKAVLRPYDKLKNDSIIQLMDENGFRYDRNVFYSLEKKTSKEIIDIIEILYEKY